MGKIARVLPIAAAFALMTSWPAFAADSSAALKALDTDSDGTIDLKEAEVGAAKVFKSMDTDNDGTVDPKEVGGRLTPSEFKAADTDNDGTLDEKEYVSIVDKKFKAADTDNEGTLDAKELDSPAGQQLLKLIQ